MRELLLVGTGGFAGAVLRYCLGALVVRLWGTTAFPVGTLAVNLIGCLLIGVVVSLEEHLNISSPQIRLLVIPGFLGGFTTFSAFGSETYLLFRAQQPGLAYLNAAMHLVFCLGAVWAGHRLGDLVSRGG